MVRFFYICINCLGNVYVDWTLFFTSCRHFKIIICIGNCVKNRLNWFWGCKISFSLSTKTNHTNSKSFLISFIVNILPILVSRHWLYDYSKCSSSSSCFFN
ncbi:unnamed protein product [Meloidogyne enterolobii]|uniref:Uncharacterized protein n=1 Tax=Meloidogyne enterolobii TaxID=390850 RepID=A0ACB0XRB5_MELEN